jgi:hypothetical protein
MNRQAPGENKGTLLSAICVLEAIGAYPNGQFPSLEALWAICAPPMDAAVLLEWGQGSIGGPRWPPSVAHWPKGSPGMRGDLGGVAG